MGVLGVNTEGLHALATRCEDLADEIATSGAPQTSGNTWQPTTAAMNTVNTSVDATAQRLAGRMLATSAKLSQTAGDYTVQDAASAREIGATVI
ncbi:type VII secretion target [Mycolicibacterium hippocampi]|uniref:ESX-1 secretion-associated protein n=1 Tax=Mycolicibacterium hippocampi TaxID=659824 RepID=A0A850PQ93_9MYCO|nr:type VII secretion target [Mycolicibacterium hippocampi]NVN50290.1 hypothetical protein [Mycolicibacterium hippocampi]